MLVDGVGSSYPQVSVRTKIPNLLNYVLFSIYSF